jgi:hypothetical protein
MHKPNLAIPWLHREHGPEMITKIDAKTITWTSHPEDLPAGWLC